MSSARATEPSIALQGVGPWEKALRLNWLQSLRAISVILVMLHHLRSAWGVYFNPKENLDFLYFGHCGVDIFFVISGFIMWHVYRNDLNRPERFIPFIQRRFIRIYPVYWILTTALLVVLVLAPGEVKDYKRDFFYIVQSYSLLPLGFAQGNPIIPAAWSLFHEIKFYLFFAGCILLPAKASRWWVRGLVTLTLLHLAWLLTPDGQAAGMGFVFSPYNLQFLAGCLIAHTVGTRQPSPALATVALALGIGGIAVLGWFDAHLLLEDRLIRALAYMGPAAALVFGATTLDYLPGARDYASRFLAFVGDASYVLYLIHYPVYCLGALLLLKLGWGAQWPAWVILPALFVAAFVASVLFHAVVERPVTAFLKRRLA
jgi:exopolysaccharide production protein ExoZ